MEATDENPTYGGFDVAVLAGDYSVVPTPFDIYASTSRANDALVQPESRAIFKRILDQGWIDAIRALHPDIPMYTFWHYLRNRWGRNAGLGLITYSLALHSLRGWLMLALIAPFEGSRAQVTMRQPGSN